MSISSIVSGTCPEADARNSGLSSSSESVGVESDWDLCFFFFFLLLFFGSGVELSFAEIEIV